MYMRNLQACGKGICTSGLPAAIEIMQSSAMRHRRIRGVRSRVSGGRRTKRKNSGEEKGENERRRKRVTAGGGERERGNEERKGEKNKWMAEKREPRVASLRVVERVDSRGAACHCGRPNPCIDTPNESVCKEGYEGWVQRDEEFSRRPPASKSCLCMTMLRLADDPH